MKARSFTLFFASLFFFSVFIFLNSVTSSGEELKVVEGKPESNSYGGGGGSIPIEQFDLKEDNSFSMKPGIMKFEFNGVWYLLQLRSVKMGVSEFIIANFEEIQTDYLLDDDIDRSFIMNIDEIKSIDLDKDGKNDIIIELNGISGSTDSIGSADFSIRK